MKLHPLSQQLLTTVIIQSMCYTCTCVARFVVCASHKHIGAGGNHFGNKHLELLTKTGSLIIMFSVCIIQTDGQRSSLHCTYSGDPLH